MASADGDVVVVVPRFGSMEEEEDKTDDIIIGGAPLLVVVECNRDETEKACTVEQHDNIEEPPTRRIK